MNYKEITNFLENQAKVNYKEVIKAIIAFEKEDISEEFLDEVYENFMENDALSLLNEDLFRL